MKWIAAAALLCLTLQAAAAPFSKPQRIVSLKICTDELLLDLVPPSRIASVTFLAQEKAPLKLWPQAVRLTVNHGTAEEILAAHPDLILTDTYISPQTRAMLAKTGARVVQVPQPENFDQIRAATRQVAAAVGETARGEAMIARMDETLRDVAADRPAKPIRVAGWGGGGYVPGAGGLFDAILKAAGAENIEKEQGGYYDVETLLAANPDVLAFGDNYSDTPSLRADQNLHPALMARYAKRRITYPSALYGCGVPQSVDAARQMQTALIAVTQ
jgi:iron complex transport system substrate-binding protein